MTSATAAERPHAERSASQLGHLTLCPGYRPRNSDRTHWVTAQGTRGHEALESGETGDLESSFEERMVGICEAYASRFTIPGAEVLNELRVDTIEGRWGYCDRLVINPDDTAHLLDWKFVRSKEVVDAEVNLQGKDYVVGILEDARFARIRAITVHFVMPRFEKATFTREPFTRDQLPRLKLEIFAVLARARQTDGKRWRGSSLTPHYDACRFCGASASCVALRRIADQIGRAYDPEGYGKRPPIPEETHASLAESPDERAQLQELSTLMESWSQSVRYHNLSAALEDLGNLPTGYVLDYPKGRRQVSDAQRLLDIATEFGLTAQDLIDAASVSWTKLEQMLRDRAGKGDKGRQVASFNSRLEETCAVTRSDPSPRLARVRPATV